MCIAKKTQVVLVSYFIQTTTKKESQKQWRFTLSRNAMQTKNEGNAGKMEITKDIKNMSIQEILKGKPVIRGVK